MIASVCIGQYGLVSNTPRVWVLSGSLFSMAIDDHEIKNHQS